MRICIISEAQSPHTRRWSKSLAAAGCEIHLVSRYEADIPNVALHRCPIYSWNPVRQLVNIIRIRRLIKALNPDVIHLFGLFSVSSLGAMFLVSSYKNLVISVWGSDVVSGGDKEGYKEWLIKFYLLNRKGPIVALSHYLADQVLRYHKKRRQIEIVPWGVDLKNYHNIERKNDDSRIVLGFAKKLHLLSGPDLLLKAFAYASARCQRKLILKIAGEGPLEKILKQKAENLGVSKMVEWLGWLETAEQLKAFYGSIDIFVMPSRRESLGVSAIEASASGLPVIATKYGGIPEVVTHNETGILVEPGDVEELGRAIIKLAEDNDMRVKMGINARCHVTAKFDFQDSVEKMISIYRKVKIGKFTRDFSGEFRGRRGGMNRS